MLYASPASRALPKLWTLWDVLFFSALPREVSLLSSSATGKSLRPSATHSVPCLLSPFSPLSFLFISCSRPALHSSCGQSSLPACSVFYGLPCSGQVQVPLTELSLESTIKTLSSAIPRNRYILTSLNYHVTLHTTNMGGKIQWFSENCRTCHLNLSLIHI